MNKRKKKEEISDEVRQMIYARDKVCRLCGKKDKGLVIHHIIPNGDAKPENLILLCKRDHIIVHMLLAQSEKWKSVNLQQMFKNK